MDLHVVYSLIVPAYGNDIVLYGPFYPADPHSNAPVASEWSKECNAALARKGPLPVADNLEYVGPLLDPRVTPQDRAREWHESNEFLGTPPQDIILPREGVVLRFTIPVPGIEGMAKAIINVGLTEHHVGPFESEERAKAWIRGWYHWATSLGIYPRDSSAIQEAPDVLRVQHTILAVETREFIAHQLGLTDPSIPPAYHPRACSVCNPNIDDDYDMGEEDGPWVAIEIRGPLWRDRFVLHGPFDGEAAAQSWCVQFNRASKALEGALPPHAIARSICADMGDYDFEMSDEDTSDVVEHVHALVDARGDHVVMYHGEGTLDDGDIHFVGPFVKANAQAYWDTYPFGSPFLGGRVERIEPV